MSSMDWDKLLSGKRLGDKKADLTDKPRSPFIIDYDRIIFSSAFRRLQDKTQVFPLSDSDYVRTRLTHSLEASCVGRSLGRAVGKKIIKKYKLKRFEAADFGDVLAAACLGHDIGNPPFGHSGEDAIKNWFENSDLGARLIKQIPADSASDLKDFEGNAQGFRIFTRLQFPANKGGMKLTCATLGSFSKYPRSSIPLASSTDDVSLKKHGFTYDESEFFKEVADECGLIRKETRIHPQAWCRHPLAFLVEVADDICYAIIDLEDGFRLGIVKEGDILELLLGLFGPKRRSEVEGRIAKFWEPKDKVEFLRASSIGELINEVAECFDHNSDKVLNGNFESELLNKIPKHNQFKKIKEFDKENVYPFPRVVEIEAAGFEVISGLLDTFASSVEDIAMNGKKSHAKSKKIAQLIPKQFVGRDGVPSGDRYKRILKIVDCISGMTDSFAVSLFKKIRGISLPAI